MEWQTRSRRLETSLKSVLFKGLPGIVSEHLHHWHKDIIFKWIENKDPSE